MFGKDTQQNADSDTGNVIAEALLKEITKQRRHSNVKTFLFVMMFGFIFGINYFNQGILGTSGIKIPKGEDYVALVRIRGSIEPGSSSSAEQLEPSLTRAFADQKAKGVLILINSPGGTAVQGRMLFDLISRLKEEFNKKVVVFGEDLMTSGAYMASLSADRIYVTESTLTGSIGVIQQHFGYKGAAEKIGIESRAIFSGRYKHRLDPFSDLKPEDVEKSEQTMKVIHSNFILMVTDARGDLLNGSNDVVFSGDYWAGNEALQMGLVDGVSNVHSVLETEFQSKHLLDYSARRSVFSRIGETFTEFALSILTEQSNPMAFGGYAAVPR